MSRLSTHLTLLRLPLIISCPIGFGIALLLFTQNIYLSLIITFLMIIGLSLALFSYYIVHVDDKNIYLKRTLFSKAIIFDKESITSVNFSTFESICCIEINEKKYYFNRRIFFNENDIRKKLIRS